MTVMSDKLRELAKKPGAEKLASSVKKADERKANFKKNGYKGNKPKAQAHESQLHKGGVDTRRAQAVHENKQNRQNQPKKVVQVTIKKSRKIQNSAVAGTYVSPSTPLVGAPDRVKVKADAFRDNILTPNSSQSSERSKAASTSFSAGYGKNGFRRGETVLITARSPGKSVPISEDQIKNVLENKDTLTERGVNKLNKLIDEQTTKRKQAKKSIRGAKTCIVHFDEKGLFPDNSTKVGNGLALKEEAWAKGNIAGSTGEQSKPDAQERFNYEALVNGVIENFITREILKSESTPIEEEQQEEIRSKARAHFLEKWVSDNTNPTREQIEEELKTVIIKKSVPTFVASAPRSTEPGKVPAFVYLDETGFTKDLTIGDLATQRKKD